MFTPNVSPEVLDLIGHELRGDKKTLSSLSKSCFLAAQVFQPFLFESLRFQDDDFTTDIFQTAPSLGHSVKSLRLQCGNLYDRSDRCNAIRNPVRCSKILRCFERVKHVFLSHDWGYESGPEYLTLENALVELVTRPTIISITMVNCRAIPIAKIANAVPAAPVYPRVKFLNCNFSNLELDANRTRNSEGPRTSSNQVKEVGSFSVAGQTSPLQENSRWTPKTLQLTECSNFWTGAHRYFDTAKLETLVMEYPASLQSLRLWAISHITELKLEVCNLESGTWTFLTHSGVLCELGSVFITFRNTPQNLEERLDNINTFLRSIRTSSLSVKVVTNAHDIDRLAAEIGQRLAATLQVLPKPVRFKLGLSLFYPGILWPIRRDSYPWKKGEFLYDWMDQKESEMRNCLTPGEQNVEFGIYWEGHVVGPWDFFPSQRYRRYLPAPRRFMG